MAGRLPTIPRVVLDTNVVVSALVFEGASFRSLRESWQQQSVLPLLSPATAAELIRVLAYRKFRLTAGDREELLADYFPWCEAVQIPSPPPAAPRCRDPFDLPFLELAIAGHADFLVTGDADLLAVSVGTRFRVLSPGDFLGALRKK